MTGVVAYLAVAAIAANVFYYHRPRGRVANYTDPTYAGVSVIAGLIWPSTLLLLGLFYLPALVLYPARVLERRWQAFSKEGE